MDPKCNDPKLERKILLWRIAIDLYTAGWVTVIGIFLLTGGK